MGLPCTYEPAVMWRFHPPTPLAPFQACLPLRSLSSSNRRLFPSLGTRGCGGSWQRREETPKAAASMSHRTSLGPFSSGGPLR